VQVGETLEKRAQLANEIIKGVILPQFVILPVALALVWFALSRGLSPLAVAGAHPRAAPTTLAHRFRPGARRNFARWCARSTTCWRLSQTIDMQKRFIADAAHQMKTPLAGMRMQSELALRQTDQDEIHRSLEQLAKSSEAATRLVNQLLSLARAENQPQAGGMAPLELNELARSVVQDWVPASFTQRIDLGFERRITPSNHRQPVMLRELLSNLIDNALRYTPHDGGRVTVRARSDEAEAWPSSKWKTPAPASAGRARQRVRAFLPHPRHAQHRQRPGPGHRARDRPAARRRSSRSPTIRAAPIPNMPGSLFRVSFRMMPRTPFFDDIT
jgi:two-component system sensor histidine kinase TctE